MSAQTDFVQLGHGSGGQMMKRIIDEVFLEAFGSPELLAGNDAGVADLPASSDRIAMSTDSFVVTPQFFPGGDIGRLAVCGTVNDVATSGRARCTCRVALSWKRAIPSPTCVVSAAPWRKRLRRPACASSRATPRS